MGKIAVFLATFFSAVFTWISKYIGAKLGAAAAVAVVSLSMLVALTYLMKGLLFDLVWLVPYEPFLMAFYACWPSNAETCIATCFSADIAVFMYKYKNRLMALVSSAQ